MGSLAAKVGSLCTGGYMGFPFGEKYPPCKVAAKGIKVTYGFPTNSMASGGRQLSIPMTLLRTEQNR